LKKAHRIPSTFLHGKRSWHSTGRRIAQETHYRQQSVRAPMLVTFYASPVTLTTSDMPRTLADWNQLSKRRVFQVHTPDAMATFYGDFENLAGGCE